MGKELLETESDALLLVIEIENYHIELLVELHNLLGMAYAAPRKVGDMNETVNAAKVDEHTVAGDVLDCTLKYLTFLKLSDDLTLLLLKLGLDESLVADNDILEFLIDLNDLELHGLAHEDIIVADGLDVDL